VPDFSTALILKMKKLWQLFRKIYRISIPLYTVFLLYLMFFGFGRSPYDFNIVRLIPLVSTVDFARETIRWRTILINIFGNVLMFVPFGFLGIVFPKLHDFRKLMIHFLAAIITVESLQYFTRLGVLDVDDIILNSLGVAIGFLSYRWLDRHLTHKDF